MLVPFDKSDANLMLASVDFCAPIAFLQAFLWKFCQACILLYINNSFSGEAGWGEMVLITRSEREHRSLRFIGVKFAVTLPHRFSRLADISPVRDPILNSFLRILKFEI